LRVLGARMVGAGEFLPVQADDGEMLHLFHITKRIDALDTERSELEYLPGTQRVLTVRRPVFIRQRMSGTDVFRLPWPSSGIYVSPELRSQIESADLKGVRFSETFDW
jgi:hypothetical protein